MIMPQINLSYIVSTKNKLPYFKRSMERLLSHRGNDEEILVADGNSSDGTKEYISSLKAHEQIQFAVSEPDFGVAHALNKLILKANGTLIKFITDDDAFDYDTIGKIKTFLLSHPNVDLVNTEGGSLNNPARALRETDPLQVVRALCYSERFTEWKERRKPFPFCDLGIVFRRSSLSVIGLYDASFPGPDIEYSFRISAGKSSIAWYTGYSYVNISNPQSVSQVYMKKIQRQMEKLDEFYLGIKPKKWITRKAGALGNKIRNGFSFKPTGKTDTGDFADIWPKLVDFSDQWLKKKNSAVKGEFLT